MTIIAFNFTKITAERKDQRPGSVSIKNSVNIKDVHKTKIALGPASQEVLRIMFEFTSTYDPSYGKIAFEGDVLHVDKADKIESAFKTWQKDKKLPKEEARAAINHILSRCNVEAIILSRELNLPSPIELPRITAK
ncbi:MAG TPA: hypothetical protein VLJ21_05160 [Candidatus Binatia bacterium]|nr:hypothetical protein [Candidatus Binatia bacterium]